MPRLPNTSPSTRTILSVLLRDLKTWRHGYDLGRETGLKSGTLYPILLRLSDQGLLEAKWVPSPEPGRPPRHAYRLTAAGRSAAHALLTKQRKPADRSRTKEAPA